MNATPDAGVVRDRDENFVEGFLFEYKKQTQVNKMCRNGILWMWKCEKKLK